MESIFIPQGAEGGCPKCGASKPTYCACLSFIDELRRIADRQGQQTKRATARKVGNGYEVHIGERLVASCSIQWAAVLTSVLNLPYADILSLLSQERERREAATICPHIVTADEGTSYCGLAESSVAALRQQLTEAQAEVEGLKYDNQRQHDEIKRLSANVKKQGRTIQDMEGRMNQERSAKLEAQSDVVSLRQALQAAEARADDMATCMEAAEQYYQEGIIEIREAFKRANAGEPQKLVAELIADDVIHNAVAGCIDGLMNRIERIEKERDTLQRAYKGREKAKEMWFKKAEERAKEIQRLKNELALRDGDLLSMQELIKMGDENTLKYLEQKQVRDAKEFASLRSELAEAKAAAVEFANLTFEFSCEHCGDDWYRPLSHGAQEAADYLLSKNRIEQKPGEKVYRLLPMLPTRPGGLLPDATTTKGE